MPQKTNLERPWLVSALLLLTTLAVYLPVVGLDFLTFDDDYYVTRNPQVTGGLTWAGLHWAFTHAHSANWHPLTWLSHMLDCQLYGLNPAGHHLTSLLFHAANAVLLFLWLRSLTRAFWRSAFVAALFALHPLHVESVAWVAERKDVLCAFFGLLSLWAYTRYARAKSEGRNPKSEGNPKAELRRDGSQSTTAAAPHHASRITHQPPNSELRSSIFYLLSLICFALGLMSKPMLVTLPFVLLLLDYWPLQRLQPSTRILHPSAISRLAVEKAPFLLLAVASSVITFVVQRKGDAVSTSLTLGERLANVLVSYARYIGKLVWPQNLSVFYPHPGQWPKWQVAASAALLLAFCVSVILLARKRPYLPVGWLWFCGTLVPVIGLVQVGAQSMADRYTYLPAIGLFIIVAWGTAEIAANWPQGRLALATAATAALASCALTSQIQLSYWQNTESLFRHAAQVTRNNYVAWNNLGGFLAEHRQLRQADLCYRAAIESNPSSEEAWSNLGATLTELNRKEEAVEAYETALRINPRFVKIHNNLAKALAAAGRLEEAQAQCREAAQLDPGSAEPHNNLGALLTREGKWDEAVRAFRQAIALDPGMHEARCGLGGALAKQGHYEDAVDELLGLLKVQPTNAPARLQLAGVLVTQGKTDQAVSEYAEVLRGNPKDATTHYRLALALMQQHNTRKAIEHYRAALEARPNSSDALNNLAWTLATSPDPQLRDGRQAVELAERACRLTEQKRAFILGTLAAAYAEAGRFTEAVATAETAIALAEKAGDQEVAAMNRKLLGLYRLGQPYRDTP
jgi:tetratricopeptide (TPR) repeat protein